MEFNEGTFKDDVSNIVKNIQKLLKQNEMIKTIQINQNMGPLKDLHADAKSVFPNCFTGAKLTMLTSLKYNLLEKVNILQEYKYGSSKKKNESYIKVFHKEMESRRKNNLFVFNTSPEVTATYREVIGDGIDVTVVANIKDSTESDTEVCFEKSSKLYNASMAVALKNMDPQTISVVWQWLEQITPVIRLGYEVGVKHNQTSLLPEKFSISGRYYNPSFTLSSTLGYSSQICFFKNLTSEIDFAAIMTFTASGMSCGSAVRKTFKDSSQMKMYLDSKSGFGVTYEKELYLLDKGYDTRTFRIIASTVIDKEYDFKFGLGINIDL